MSELFVPGSLGPVQYGDRTLWLSHWLELKPGARIHVLFEGVKSAPRQGMRVFCRNNRHVLRTNGVEANTLVLWTDTAPPHVEINIPPGRVAREVGFQNVWELPGYGTMMYSVNSACMAVSQVRDGEFLLECSDGYGVGEPRFNDLVVRLILEDAT